MFTKTTESKRFVLGISMAEYVCVRHLDLNSFRPDWAAKHLHGQHLDARDCRKCAGKRRFICLATGYFNLTRITRSLNLTQNYMDSLLETSQPNVHILMAYPLVFSNVPNKIPHTVFDYIFLHSRMDFSGREDSQVESHQVIHFIGLPILSKGD